MNPADDRSVGDQRPEHRDRIVDKQSAGSEEDGSVGRLDSTSDHSDLSEKGHSGPSSDEDCRVEDGEGIHWLTGTASSNRDEGKKRHRRGKQAGRRHHTRRERRVNPYGRTDVDNERLLLMQAPRNTTQYIMDDHPDSSASPGTNSNSCEETFRQAVIKEFSHQYKESMAQEFKTYTKPELIQKVIELEMGSKGNNDFKQAEVTD